MALKFIDLFAGLGGFHLALSKLGAECVFSSELDPYLRNLYQKNFGVEAAGDIRECIEDIPPHDILCAGFPCQPFSKAGDQKGFDCPQWGDLFSYVLAILRKHKPRYIIIENVPNLLKHANGETWSKVSKRLESIGYEISASKLSPHMFGVPQIRERAIIVGSLKGLKDFEWPTPTHTQANLSISSILDREPLDAKYLSKNFINYLTVWQNLLDQLPENEPLPSFPIWAMEFGATYPYEKTTPFKIGYENLRRYKGALGKSLRLKNIESIRESLPVYARSESNVFPDWKINFIKQNRDFYKKHQEVIDNWLPQIVDFSPSFQKLEWNWKGGPRDIWSTIIQFRASGIRVKKPTASPALVALTASQVPVIAWEKRYMTIQECSRLQSMGELKHLPTTQTGGFKALGNAVNVNVIAAVAKALLGKDISIPQKWVENFSEWSPNKHFLEGLSHGS